MGKSNSREIRWVLRTGAGLLLCAGLATPGCGGRSQARADEGVDLGLDRLLNEGGGSIAVSDDAAPAPAQDESEYGDLAAQALDAAMNALDGMPAIDNTPPEVHATADTPEPVEPVEIAIASEGSGDEPGEERAAEAEDATLTAAEQREHLLGKLQESLTSDLATDSEPLRKAVMLVALAATQGDDPHAVLADGTVADEMLSPTELEAAGAIADLLGLLLAPASSTPQQRAALLDELSERLGESRGIMIPTARLCTRVAGFGNYEPFGSTTFLAGRPVRAIVYAEVEGFDHREVDGDGLGGLEMEERWAVEVSQELKLTHKGETATLAWRMPAEKVVQTSRNRLRDFYLVTEIALPPTLSIGEYELKVAVRDDVSDSLAEAIIPVKIVADPALAWQGD